jgi:hypothetical protein
MSCSSEHRLELTGIPAANSSELEPVTCTWEQFVDELQHEVGKKDGVAFVAGTFTTYDEGRKNRFVEKINLLVYDVDGVTPSEAEAILRRLPFKGVVYTTYRHKPELQRFRIVLLLSRPVEPDGFPVVWAWGAELIGSGIDNNCKDISRLHYLPRVPDDEAVNHAWVRRLEGPIVDPDEILTAPKKEAEQTSEAIAIIVKYWPEEGQRQEFVMALAGYLLRRGVSEEECEELILQAATEAGDEEADKRAGVVQYTRRKLEAKEKVTGIPRLRKILGKESASSMLSELRAALKLEPTDNSDIFAGLGSKDKAPSFPVEVLPEKLQEYVRICAQAFGCPVDFFGVSILVVAAAMIGMSRAVAAKPSWTESPRIYAAIVADPGSAKTPAVNYVLKPIHQIQGSLSNLFAESFRKHEAEKQKYERELSVWKKDKKTGDPPTPPKEPTLERIIASDTTIEALCKILNDNLRGILIARDELTAWVCSMNQYKSRGGADRQVYLSLWSGEPLTVDRKKHPLPLILQAPFVCVFGALTPDMLPELGDERGRQDGFIHRILFSYPDGTATGVFSEEEIPEEIEKAWHDAVRRLRELEGETCGDGQHSPVVVELEVEAKEIFVQFFDEVVGNLTDPNFPYELHGPWSKLRSYCLRVAVVLHELQNVFAESPSETVSARTMSSACDVITYFQGHIRKVYRSLRTTSEDRRIERAVQWLKSHDGRATLRNLARNNVAGVKKASEAQRLANDLVDRGLARITEKPSKKGGRTSRVVELLSVLSGKRRSNVGSHKES